ncbi:MAG: hypothetical protein AAGI38_16970, partial [Bacteroidota bacterium]
MKLVLAIVSFTLLHLHAASQVIPDQIRRENYTLRVKQLDEFIDRFNFNPQTPVIQYIRSKYPDQKLSRSILIRSLFNIYDKTWSNEKIDTFIDQIDNPSTPHFLKFNDDRWFAEVECVFLYKGEEVEVTLVLQNTVFEDYSSKWMIIGAKADFLPRRWSIKPLP